jgi:hypothetical protein
MPPLTLGTYDPTEVMVSFKGIPIDGFAAGTFIKVSRNEDGWTFQPSNSGGGARSRNPNRSGRIEITLHAASPANGYLSAFAVADELTAEGVGEFQVKDMSSTASFCLAQNAWIMKFPDWERAKETGEVTWVIESDDINIKHSGLIPNV